MVILWSRFAKQNLLSFVKNSKMFSPSDYVKSLVQYVNLLSEQKYLGAVLHSSQNLEEALKS